MKRVVMYVFFALAVFLVACSSPQTLYMCTDGTVGGAIVPDADKEQLFICPDGREVDSYNGCTYTNIITISQDDAEDKSINFVNGYVRASGWSGTLINVFPEDGSFYGQVVVSKPGEQSYETTVRVDGERGTVTCEANCLYTTQIS